MIPLVAGFGLDRIRSRLGFQLALDSQLVGPLCYVASEIPKSVTLIPATPLTFGSSTSVAVAAVGVSMSATSIGGSRSTFGSPTTIPLAARGVALSGATVSGGTTRPEMEQTGGEAC